MKASVLATEPKSIDLPRLASPILITGPAYAGKSDLAIGALRQDLPAQLFVTTDPKEDEFRERIAELQNKHSPHWQVNYQQGNLAAAIAKVEQNIPQILIDSSSQWIAARLLDIHKQHTFAETHRLVEEEIKELITAINAVAAHKRVIITSTEVGGGPSPPGGLARLFRLLSSKANVTCASLSHTVVVMHAGIPLIIKQAGPTATD